MYKNMHSNIMIVTFLMLSSGCVGQLAESNKDVYYTCLAREIGSLKGRLQTIDDSCQTEAATLKTAVNEIAQGEASLNRNFQEQSRILRNVQQELSDLKTEVANIKTKSNGQHCVHDNVPATGRDGGYYFSDWNTFVSSGYAKITKFVIRSGSRVDCFGVTYGRSSGGCHGGSGGTLRTFNLASDEYITRISGNSGREVDRIKVTTNKRVYGPYGGSGGSGFNMYGGGKHLAFISGRSGGRLDRLQLHFYC